MSLFNLPDPVDDLWKSVTSVSSQGRRRGRASRGKLMKRENFSKGQQGVGNTLFLFVCSFNDLIFIEVI